jgi:SM-20-related protein
MHVIDLDSVARAPQFDAPYRHFIGDGVLKPAAVDGLIADFPAIKQAGFYPVTDLSVTGAFQALMDDVNDPAFSTAVGTKLDMALADKPKLITIRRWSAASDGRIHTDSVSKIATTLIYLNERWNDDGAGRLRVLRGEKDFNDYTAEISPVAGSMFGFRRSDTSWHGHLPFAGERKVVQVTWLIDDSKVAHKTRTAKFTRLLKRLNPFS